MTDLLISRACRHQYAINQLQQDLQRGASYVEEVSNQQQQHRLLVTVSDSTCRPAMLTKSLSMLPMQANRLGAVPILTKLLASTSAYTRCQAPPQQLLLGQCVLC